MITKKMKELDLELKKASNRALKDIGHLYNSVTEFNSKVTSYEHISVNECEYNTYTIQKLLDEIGGKQSFYTETLLQSQNQLLANEDSFTYRISQSNSVGDLATYGNISEGRKRSVSWVR